MTEPMDIDECKEWLIDLVEGRDLIHLNEALLALEALEEYWFRLYKDNDD